MIQGPILYNFLILDDLALTLQCLTAILAKPWPSACLAKQPDGQGKADVETRTPEATVQPSLTQVPWASF